MQNKDFTYSIVLFVGLISITFGIYELISGAPLKEYAWSIFIGITLVGTVYFQRKSDRDSERTDE